MKNPIPYIFILPNFVEQEFIAFEITKYKLTKPMQHQSKPFSRKKSYSKSDEVKLQLQLTTQRRSCTSHTQAKI